MRLVSRGIVITASAHNPSILHPAFLKAQGIVDQDFDSIDSKLICTPAFSGVAFTNGIRISVDEERLTISADTLPQAGPEVPPLASIAERYLSVLPHVQYKKVGVNFRNIITRSDPGSFIIEKFTSPGPWRNGLVSAEVGFRYEIVGGELNIRIVPVKKSSNQNRETGISVRFNYSFDLDSASILQSAIARLHSFDELESDMRTKMKMLLGA